MRRFGGILLFSAAIVLAAGCSKKGKAVPAEVEIDWPDAAPPRSAKDADAGPSR